MENEIVIQGQVINISKLSDEQIIKLFTELEERELRYREKILALEKKIENLKENI